MVTDTPQQNARAALIDLQVPILKSTRNQLEFDKLGNKNCIGTPINSDTNHRTNGQYIFCAPIHDPNPPIFPISNHLCLEMAPTFENGTFSSAVPPSTSNIKSQYPPVWPSQPSQPSSAVAAYAAHHMARNISGDAAWPPGRPPSSGTDFARVEADPALMTARAQLAWSKPVQRIPQSEIDAALREAIEMTKPRAIVSQGRLPAPFHAFAPDAVPANLDLEIFKDPEASVTKCEIRYETVAARPRSLTNAAANRQWRMNQLPRGRTSINRDDNASQREDTSSSAVADSLLSPTLQVSTSSAVVVSRLPSPAHVTPIISAVPSIWVTPRDLLYLDYVLDGRMSPDDPANWVTRVISDLTRQFSTGTAGFLAYPSLRPWLGNGSIASGRTEGNGRKESLDRLDKTETPSLEKGQKVVALQRSDDGATSKLEDPRLSAADATTPGTSTITLHSDLSPTRPHTLREDDHSDEDADTVWITLPAEPYPPEHPGEGRTSELFAVFGKQCLETGTDETGVLFPIHATTSRVTDYHRFNVTVGVSLAGNGAVTAGVIWGIQAKPSEAYDNPAFGWVGNEWEASIVRVIPAQEVGHSPILGDATVLGLLAGAQEQLDRLRQTVVCNKEEMHKMVATLLLLLEVGTAARDEGNGPDRVLRVPPDNPPLAPPEGGGGR
jgi:hypothetical protein